MADSHAEAHHEQKHPFHLVDPSPWPLIGALSAGTFATGMIVYMHYASWPLLIIGILMILGTMFGWWRSVIKESHAGYHNPIVQFGLRYGMVLFITSEAAFFAAFFWAFFHSSMYPSEAIGSVWPPADVETFSAFDVPLLNTLVLLLSGCTVTWAHHSLLEGHRRGLILGLACTVGLGLFFSILQALEYYEATFAFDGGIYSSTFYMTTGFHGFHVIVGTIFLAVCLFRAIKGHFTPQHHFGFEAAAWYWHFVDVVWLFLWVFMYWYFGG